YQLFGIGPNSCIEARLDQVDFVTGERNLTNVWVPEQFVIGLRNIPHAVGRPDHGPRSPRELEHSAPKAVGPEQSHTPIDAQRREVIEDEWPAVDVDTVIADLNLVSAHVPGGESSAGMS